jgi:hypothetical protein
LVKQADAAVDSISATINNFNNLVFAGNLLEDEVSISMFQVLLLMAIWARKHSWSSLTLISQT